MFLHGVFFCPPQIVINLLRYFSQKAAIVSLAEHYPIFFDQMPVA